MESSTNPLSIPGVTSTLEKLQNSYGPQAQAFGQNAHNTYFSYLWILQLISVVVSLILFAASIYFLIQTGFLASRIDRIQDVILRSDTSKKRAQSSWNDIERHFFTGDDNDLRIAIIEADNLLDEALRTAGVQGSNVGDRLKRVRVDQLPNVDDVWQAHKLRNRIAHEPNFALKRDLAERALTVYEKALANLGLLDSATGLTEPTESTPHSPTSP